MMVYLYFAIYNILQPLALILQKIGLNEVGAVNLRSFSSLFGAVTNPYVICGIGLSGVGVVFWLAALSRMNLSYLQPFGAIVYIIIAIASHFILGETITVTRWIGIVIIVIGAYLINV